MTEGGDPIETAVLARLMVKSKKPPTEAEVIKSVAMLFGSDAARSGERIRKTLERLQESGLCENGGTTLTEKGKTRALGLLEWGPRAPMRWPALKARLAEVALGRKAGKSAMTASAMRARALSAKLGLPEESSSPSKVLDAWAARELGMSGKRLTVANVRAHVLTRALGIDSLRDPKRIGAVATAKVLDVARTDASSVREAVLRDWLAPPAPKMTARDLELDSFAATVKELARESEDRFGRYKVFIAPVWERAQGNAKLRGLSESEFKAKLVDAHRAGLLRLSRADLTPAMSREMVAASEVPYLNAVFHFVDLEGTLS